MQAFCSSGTLNFTQYFFLRRFKKRFIVNSHHKQITDVLDLVLKGVITRVIINIAPRYSKTELAVKNFSANGLALNPSSKFIHLSYSDDLANSNSEEVRDIVKSDYYKQLFPYVEISKTTDSKKKWNTTKGGGMYAVSTGGQVTGFGAGEVDYDDSMEDPLLGLIAELDGEIDSLNDCCKRSDVFSGAIIIDDPIKPEDALSDTIRERVNQRFETTIRNRVNSRKTPIIIIMQRLHENDLCGYLLEQEPDEWFVLSLPCIYEDENGAEKALWEHKHTLEELKAIKRNNSFVFETQYQQDPKPIEGLLLPKETLRFAPVNSIPEEYIVYKFAIVDPADKGGDKYSVPYLHVVQHDNDFAVYVKSAIHNKNGIEANTSRVMDRCKEHGIEHLFVEKNGVGLSALFELTRECKESGTSVIPFTSSTEKIVRIISNYEFVQKYFIFDCEYESDSEFKEFMSDLTSFRKEGDNKHKMDAMDILCSAASALKIKYRQYLHK